MAAYDLGRTAAQMASDPTTPLETLADLAYREPVLRPIVAANPATYEGLLMWLEGLGDPLVDAAIRARDGQAPNEPAPHVAYANKSLTSLYSTGNGGPASSSVWTGQVTAAITNPPNRLAVVLAIASFIGGDITGILTTSGVVPVVVQAAILGVAIAVLRLPIQSRILAFGLLGAALLVTALFDANVNTVYSGYHMTGAGAGVLQFFFLGFLSPALGLSCWLVARNRARIAFLVGLPAAVVVNSALIFIIEPLIWSEIFRTGGYYSGDLVTGTIVIDLVEIGSWVGLVLLAGRLDSVARAVRGGARSRVGQLPRGSTAAPLMAAGTDRVVHDSRYADQPYSSEGQVRTNVVAILALVLGLFGSAVVAIVLGHVALAQIRRTGENGRGLAIAGLVLGYIATAVLAGLLIFYGVLFATLSSSGASGY